MNILKPILIVILCSLFLTNCQTPLRTSRTSLNVETFDSLERRLKDSNIKLSFFQKFGPFQIKKTTNQNLQVTKNTLISYDMFAPQHKDKSPLIIISHGNKSLKEAHRFQAERLASWGFYVMTVQLPKVKDWIRNGKRLYLLTKYLHTWPDILAENFDHKKIILSGHSFGGSAISIAAGMGAPVLGLILLDPAIVSNYVIGKLKKIKSPAILLGADKKVFLSRRRKLFFEKVPKNIAEISIKGATHDDAQYPSMFSIYNFGMDPYTSKEKQEYFLSSILMTAFSYSMDKNLDFVWAGIQREVKRGKIIEARIK